MVQQTEVKANQSIKRIKEMLEEVAANPDDYDIFKIAVEIYELVDARQSHYSEPVWHHNQNILRKGG